MGAVKEGQVPTATVSIGEEKTISALLGKAAEELRKKHDGTVEAFLVELLRRPDCACLRSDDIQLVIQHRWQPEIQTVTYHYRIEIHRKIR